MKNRKLSRTASLRSKGRPNAYSKLDNKGMKLTLHIQFEYRFSWIKQRCIFVFIEFVSINYEDEYESAQQKFDINRQIDSHQDQQEDVVLNLKHWFYRYVDNKYGIDALTFDQFWKVPFPHKFPNLFFDISYSLGWNLDKITPDRHIGEIFKNWVICQYKGKTIINDQNIISKRNEESYLYYNDKRDEYINDIIKYRGRVQKIDISFLLKERDRKPKITYS